MLSVRPLRLVASAVAGTAAIAVLAGTALADTPQKPVTRLAGNDRIATAVAISKQAFPTDHTAKNVVLTAAYRFPDAMSAAPLGKDLTAPLLLTTPGELAPATPAAILEQQRRNPARKIGYTVLKNDFFVISGTQGAKKFYMRAAAGANDVRGVTLVYDPAVGDIMDRIVVAVSSAFAAFGARYFTP